MSFATLRKNVCIDTDIGTALKEIASNPHISDVLAFDLLDGRHIECAVTDIDDNAIRFDSVDCLGDDMIYGNVEKWLDCMFHRPAHMSTAQRTEYSLSLSNTRIWAG